MNKDACKTVVVRGLMRCFVQSATRVAPLGGPKKTTTKPKPESNQPLEVQKMFFLLLINMKVLSGWCGFNTDVRIDEVERRSLSALLGL